MPYRVFVEWIPCIVEAVLAVKGDDDWALAGLCRQTHISGE